MVLEEQPAKLAEAFRLFLQGEGYGKCWGSWHWIIDTDTKKYAEHNNSEENANETKSFSPLYSGHVFFKVIHSRNISSSLYEFQVRIEIPYLLFQLSKNSILISELPSFLLQRKNKIGDIITKYNLRK